MQRRDFIKTTALSAVAISTTGFIRFDGKHYIGDCETTSDVLGPFYRPDSPLRQNLVIEGQKGDPIELMGKILHEDCITPYKNAKIELWHCDGNGIYDNESEDFKYRGTAYSDQTGSYSFNTILPVPYGEGENYRPAHFHLMITTEGYQPLVTQLYFVGDPWIEKDELSSSPTAKRRILEVQSLRNGSKKVEYNVSMAQKLAAEPSAIERLTGLYVNEKDSTKTMELFNKDKQLWMKNEPFGQNLEYLGMNTFTLPGIPPQHKLTFVFEPMLSGAVKLTETYSNDKGDKNVTVYLKSA